MSRPSGPVRRLALLGAVTGLVLGACGGDGSVLLGTPPTTVAPTTSEAPPTTAAPVTTGTTSPPTTETTAPPPTLGPALEPLEFLRDGLKITDFGDTPPVAINAVRDYLGMETTFNSNWGPAWGDYGACPGTEYRQVRFGGLILMFTDAGYFAPEGTRHFFAWSYDGDPPNITMGPLDIGMTVASLQALYPAVVIYADDPIFGDTFRLAGPGQEQLWGRLTGTGAGDTVIHLVGGTGCGE